MHSDEEGRDHSIPLKGGISYFRNVIVFSFCANANNVVSDTPGLLCELQDRLLQRTIHTFLASYPSWTKSKPLDN